RNPLPLFIPCHRIIGSNGALTGFAHGLEIKEQLLRLEGWQNKKVFHAYNLFTYPLLACSLHSRL
ncbi:MAG: MGMT family protein, partial [Candidatus Electrothrix sp. MAN1_4]|nr:MGMT family protein [Candidatus Electrothrix sp. MAN1_4]